MGNFLDTSLLQRVKVEIYFSCQIWRQSLYFQSDLVSINTNRGNKRQGPKCACLIHHLPDHTWLAASLPITSNLPQSLMVLGLFFYHKWFFCLSWLARHAAGAKNACLSCMRSLGSISNTTGKKTSYGVWHCLTWNCFKVSDITINDHPPKSRSKYSWCLSQRHLLIDLKYIHANHVRFKFKKTTL